MDNRSIGFFDSGVGGLTTLIEVKNLLPYENYIYYADNANAPFGNKTDEEIFNIVTKGIQYLIFEDVKAIVLACNTATKICAKKLREQFDIQIFGLEPAIKPAAQNGQKTLILTTKATAQSSDFKILLGKYGQNSAVMACENLARYVENNLGSPKLYGYVNKLLCSAHIELYSNIVLGCTHYVFLRDMISQMFPTLNIFDGNLGLAKNVLYKFTCSNMLSENGCGDVKIHTTACQNISYHDIIEFPWKFTNLCH